MKKVMKFLGIEVYASNKSIKGKKSSGSEDIMGFKNWRSKPDCSVDSMN